MNSVREYHNEAIRYAQLAMAALQEGDSAEHNQLVRNAMISEKNAANLVSDEKSSEPTRSILYRSAASFAYQAGEYEEAERLVFKGMSGYPPQQIRQQLMEVQRMSREALSHQESTGNGINLSTQQIVTAIYENGALYPITSLLLKEHQKVEIQIFSTLEVVPG